MRPTVKIPDVDKGLVMGCDLEPHRDSSGRLRGGALPESGIVGEDVLLSSSLPNPTFIQDSML